MVLHSMFMHDYLIPGLPNFFFKSQKSLISQHDNKQKSHKSCFPENPGISNYLN